jgi:hypothetical protein
MRIFPQTRVDHGCWISDDNVYGFISSELHGIGEIGFHGGQPVSRNSRVLAGPAGVCTFWIQNGSRDHGQVLFEDFDWLPGAVRMCGTQNGRRVEITVTASGNRLIVIPAVHGDPAGVFHIRLNGGARYTDVQGERVWTPVACDASEAVLRFRDRIVLRDWMKREGPYAGDFLIPEPLRRRIFVRRCRSGLATPDDLRPEFRDSLLHIYDAEVVIRMGGRGYRVRPQGEDFLFSMPMESRDGGLPAFAFEFSGDRPSSGGPAMAEESARNIRETHVALLSSAPRMQVPGYPCIDEFASTVPGLVESCMSKEHGIPRATPGAYYWIWSWDAMVTAQCALRWNGVSAAIGTLQFIDSHRDDGGLIPMRWTRALEPLDTQPRGSLESLLANLAYSAFCETGNADDLRALYPAFKQHLQEVSAQCGDSGAFSNMGFYPDLPLRFHRAETSAVAMEIGNFFTFCRICENAAIALGDGQTRRDAAAMADRVGEAFEELFWDHTHGFPVDSVNLADGEPNVSFPLFTLFFLHSPLGWPLMRRHVAECASFIARHHLTATGLRLLPPWDINARSETVSASWYPHWDYYALKILRRTGRSDEIVKWLGGVRQALDRLGYAPEFVALDTMDQAGPAQWQHHGAASNLNCVTGWYQALLEGVYGLEADPGGITIIPLRLPLGTLSLTGIRFRSTRWDVSIDNGGSGSCRARVDGQELSGCLKIPAKYYDGGAHQLDVYYDASPPSVQIHELINAELTDVMADGEHVTASIRALGGVEMVYSAPGDGSCLLDGYRVHPRDRLPDGRWCAYLQCAGEHTVRI